MFVLLWDSRDCFAGLIEELVRRASLGRGRDLGSSKFVQ